MYKKRTYMLILILFVIPFISINNNNSHYTDASTSTYYPTNSYNDFLYTPDISPFFSLEFKTQENSVFSAYTNFIQQYLVDIGIDLDVTLQDWPTFLDTLLANRDFDITSIHLGGSKSDIDNFLQSVFTVGGTLNLWGYDELMDWNSTLSSGLNEWYIEHGATMIPPNSQERIDHYWEWQQYIMDELLLMLPLFNPNQYSVNWENLDGFNYSNGDLIHNWGKLSWDGLHTGQVSAAEIVTHRDNWTELNPLFADDMHSDFIIDACLDKLIYLDSDSQFWPHLADSWTFINDTTLDVTLRDDIKWMDYGGFTNEYLDVKDLYFSLFCYRNISIFWNEFEWIKDFEIQDDMTLRIFIDEDPGTAANDPSVYCLEELNNYILPEHYLNQTQEIDGITPDITHATWADYATYCWGTSLFEIDTYTEAVETILTVKSDCWLLDPMVDKSNMDFVNRFGDFSGGLIQLRVRILDNQTLIKSEFDAGKLDIMKEITWDYLDQYNADSNLEVQSRPIHNFSFLGYNVRESRGTPLQSRDPCPLLPSMTKGLAIRKAIAHAINQTEIDNEVHNDTYNIIDCPIYPTLGIWCNEDIIKYDYNLTKAKEYMMYAGYDCGLDTDSDGLTDYIELNTTNTDRFNSDSDSDGMPDGWEVNNSLDPLINDANDDEDSDGLSNIGEYDNNTNPNDDDSDNDTLLDGWEVTYGLNPLFDDSSLDSDSDYLTNLEEYSEGTIPIDADTDKDLLLDGHEVNGIYSPSNPGADINGYVFTNPLLADTDFDGYIDSVELFSDSDPNDPNDYPQPEIITITPPIETITDNQTITTTVTTGIIFGVTVATIGLVLTITVFISRKVRKK